MNVLSALQYLKMGCRPGQRILDAAYGPQAKLMRKNALDRLIPGRMPNNKQLQWGNFRLIMLQAVGATGDCKASQDADFEAKANLLLDVPAASPVSPVSVPKEEDAANNGPSQVPMSKKSAAPANTESAQDSTSTPPAAGKPKKTTCPVTREQFNAKAPRSIAVKIGETVVSANLHDFSSGSLGWYFGDKVTIEVDGVPCRVQVGLNMTLIGSKDLPQ